MTSPVLAVYVVWHPACEEAIVYKEAIFRTLCANPAVPASRGLGVQVRFRTTTSSNQTPTPIPFGDARHTVVFVLVDDELVANRSWRSYADGLVGAAGDDDLVVPVAITAVENLPPNLAGLQAIRLYGKPSSGAQLETLLLNDVMHDICQRLDPGAAKVKVFLSHARADGREITRSIRNYLLDVARLEDFFDAEIADGKRFADVLMEQAGSVPALLAVQTDTYASREWCRLELLEAKRRRVPIVVLSALQDRESRSFPYMGNVPVVRWCGNESLPAVVGALLGAVLRDRYFPRRAEGICRYHGIAPELQVFSSPPELLTLLAVRDSIRSSRDTENRYLYPDPPLGTEERELLQQLEPNIDLVTPTDLEAR